MDWEDFEVVEEEDFLEYRGGRCEEGSLLLNAMEFKRGWRREGSYRKAEQETHFILT